MPDNFTEVFWDPSQEQLKLNQPISPTALLGAGYKHLALDTESVPGSGIHIYYQKNRWYVCLVDGSGVVVASALCFSSGVLGSVVREMQAVAGVL